MALDPSIILATRPAPIENPQDMALKSAQLRGLNLANQQHQQELDANKKLNEAFRNSLEDENGNPLTPGPQPAGPTQAGPPAAAAPLNGPTQTADPSLQVNAPPPGAIAGATPAARPLAAVGTPGGPGEMGATPPVAVPAGAAVPPAAAAPAGKAPAMADLIKPRQPPKFNREKFAATMIASGQGAKVPGILKGFAEADKQSAELAKFKSELDVKERDAIGSAAAASRIKGDDGQTHFDADVLQGQLLHGVHVMGYQSAVPMLVALQAAPPEQRQVIADHIGSTLVQLSDEQRKLSAADTTAEARARTAATAARKQEVEEPGQAADADAKRRANYGSQLASAPSQQRYRQIWNGIPAGIAQSFPNPDAWDAKTTPALARKAGMTPAQQQTAEHEATEEAQGAKRLQLSWSEFQERVRHNKEIEEGTTLSPEAQEKAADMLATTGNMPSLGMGAAAGKMRAQIMDRAAKKYADVDWASAGANFKANQNSLKTMQGQRDAVGAFEETALKNSQVFLDAAKKIIDTGSPLLNKPLRSIDEKALGSGEQAAFNTARRTVVPEFAKILNNPTLSGQLSDSARHEIDSIMAGDATLKQIYDSLAVLKKDTANRRQSYDDAIDNIKKRMVAQTTGKAKTEHAPNLEGLKPGTGRTFHEGPHKGETWTIGADGTPRQVT